MKDTGISQDDRALRTIGGTGHCIGRLTRQNIGIFIRLRVNLGNPARATPWQQLSDDQDAAGFPALIDTWKPSEDCCEGHTIAQPPFQRFVYGIEIGKGLFRRRFLFGIKAKRDEHAQVTFSDPNLHALVTDAFKGTTICTLFCGRLDQDTVLKLYLGVGAIDVAG